MCSVRWRRTTSEDIASRPLGEFAERHGPFYPDVTAMPTMAPAGSVRLCVRPAPFQE